MFKKKVLATECERCCSTLEDEYQSIGLCANCGNVTLEKLSKHFSNATIFGLVLSVIISMSLMYLKSNFGGAYSETDVISVSSGTVISGNALLYVINEAQFVFVFVFFFMLPFGKNINCFSSEPGSGLAGAIMDLVLMALTAPFVLFSNINRYNKIKEVLVQKHTLRVEEQ